MSIRKPIKNQIQTLKKEYDSLLKDKESLLEMIDEVEIVEAVYNSNAIENSTLTLKETEKILLEQELSRDVSLREVFEAKNLSRISEYIKNKTSQNITIETILFLHQILIGGINDHIAGRFRQKGEYVRVGTHIAPAPEHVDAMIDSIITQYNSDFETYFLEKIAKFHLDFENIHPFNDRNGRIGRVIINYQLQQLGFPSIIIRNKEKQKYYDTFAEYRTVKKTNKLNKILSLSLLESLHKRIAYLKGEEIINLSEFAKRQDKTSSTIFNAAKRQTIPAFREKGIWKINSNFLI
jgi:Fic family protein